MRQGIMGGASRHWLVGVALLVAAAAPVKAQGNGYLFGIPDAQLTIHAGWFIASASSDFYTQAQRDFTLDKSDFNSPTVGAELGIRLASQLDFSLDASWSGMSHGSHYRNFVDNNNQEIEQSTTLRRVPVTANLKAFLVPRGRAVGRLAYIPSKVVPWIGAGVGASWYSLEQSGDFINTSSGAVFTDSFRDSGWGPAFQGMGGVDVSLTPRIALTGDARYLWSKASLGGDFQGYDKIDLSGVSLALGVTFRL
jgi:opacity protein-like surface antigen